MRIGFMVGAGTEKDNSLVSAINFSKRVEQLGFDNVWMANIFGYDAMTMMAAVGRETTTLGVGTAVIPTYPRHPMAMAQQAMTTAAMSNGRFALGIGLSHKIVIENMLGMSYDKPAKHMREYLDVLIPLLKGENVSYQGEQYNVHCQLDVADKFEIPVIVAALGPVMLKLAGQMTAGTSTWMTGVDTLEKHIIPTITAATNDAGRAAPRVVAGLPIVLTSDVDAAKAKIDKALAVYGNLPSYRAMLDKEGSEGPSGVALLGDETALRKKIQQLRDIGVTDFNAAVMNVEEGAFERTLAFLQSELS
ncbi:LLM class F420-dependent oxidoreductase [Oceanicoccus sp. KOV_DT_Chl]|uniref:LLM class F420-dependent oxidoreductase n=1 Tax=Oceanicoccus sp. KOV_DT_Chl TaxID=1904639 RepID=UPI00135722E5|nr:LLM class F420-dependent oxidoreductase [Oceanicoccus sp. KOV_DT_Chl]